MIIHDSYVRRIPTVRGRYCFGSEGDHIFSYICFTSKCFIRRHQMRVLDFWQRCSWGIRSSGIWRYFVGQVVVDFSKDPIFFVLKNKQSKKISSAYLEDEENIILWSLNHSPKETASLPERSESRNINNFISTLLIHFNPSKPKDKLVPLHDIRAYGVKLYIHGF
jgi:hypothetical protein